VEKVEDFFAQTFEVRVDVHAQVSAQERQFTRLGSGLARTLAGFEMDPLRLRVRATAGSGKTFVAHAFFERAVARGRRPLLVCFNRPLAERLKALMGQAGWVSTFFGLCDAFLADRGHRLDFEQMKTDREFWRRVADMVTAETVSDGWRFDCLIVDEGQDFEQEWFEILRLFLRDDADVLWLEDPDQNLLGKPSVRLDGFARFSTAVNHRTPATIARFIQRVLPIPFECGSHLPGLGVTVTPYERSEDQPREVGKIVDGLLAQGFAYPDIAVVTMRSGRRSVFTGRARAGRHDLRQFTGEYDLFGNQVSTAGRLLFDSVHRFKGQQAAAVVLVDVDPDPTSLELEQRRLFCGMTRATVKLDLLVRAGNPFNARFLDAGAPAVHNLAR
jgi:superfamily I DNA and RNA helicase